MTEGDGAGPSREEGDPDAVDRGADRTAPTGPGDLPRSTLADRPVFHDLADRVREYLAGDATGHDVDHAFRVFDLGDRIARAEGADREVVGAAALVHDLHRVMADDPVDPADSLPAVRDLLDEAGVPRERIPAVLHCVEVHDEYAFRGSDVPATTIEAEVLRDADNLDAMGAIGIARAFAYTGNAGNPLWDPGGEADSGIGHVHEKLLRLSDEMHTETARALAAQRHAFLETFVERFRDEWAGRR